jgi:hypothetical protein
MVDFTVTDPSVIDTDAVAQPTPAAKRRGVPYGMAAAIGGDYLNALGQQQGFRSLASERQRQLAEQEALQEQSAKTSEAFIANNQPAVAAQRSQIQLAAPGQAFIQSMKDYHPMGLGAAAASAMVPGQQAATTNLSAANARLAQINAPKVAGLGLQSAESELGNQRTTIDEQSRRLAELYGQRESVAAGQGRALRQGGNLLKVEGENLSGAQGYQEGLWNKRRNQPVQPAVQPVY